MLNIEKYKNELAKIFNTFVGEGYCFESAYRAMEELYAKHCKNKNYYENFKLDFAKMLNWLLEEYKEPILDEAEREYLNEVIRPFRNMVKFIRKEDYVEHYQFIRICYKDFNGLKLDLPFPSFKAGTMYKNMELDKEYSLEELGL